MFLVLTPAAGLTIVTTISGLRGRMKNAKYTLSMRGFSNHEDTTDCGDCNRRGWCCNHHWPSSANDDISHRGALSRSRDMGTAWAGASGDRYPSHWQKRQQVAPDRAMFACFMPLLRSCLCTFVSHSRNFCGSFFRSTGLDKLPLVTTISSSSHRSTAATSSRL